MSIVLSKWWICKWGKSTVQSCLVSIQVLLVTFQFGAARFSSRKDCCMIRPPKMAVLLLCTSPGQPGPASLD